MTIEDFIQRLETLDVRKIAYNILLQHKEELKKIQYSQLWAGKDLSGENLSPTIFQDPYFNKFEDPQKSARKWADKKLSALNSNGGGWSRMLYHEPEFGQYEYGIANLIFSTGIIVWRQVGLFPFGKEDLTLGLYDTELMDEIEAKYGGVFGINPQGLVFLHEEIFDAEFYAAVMQHLIS
jgi:hypothetical protein